MILSRRQLGSAASALAGAILLPRPASATTLLALSLAELQDRSGKIALATPEQSTSVWEHVGSQRRIVTYTRAIVHEVWLTQSGDDEDPEGEGQALELVTLGGRVGDVAQHVYGSAQLTPKETSLIFAGHSRGGLRAVVGMAQGHYPLVERTGALRLRPSPQLPQIERRRGQAAAVDQLQELDLPSARKLLGGTR